MMNDTIDNTRRMASDALERASSTMKDLRSGVSDRASAARNSMGEYANAARNSMGEYASASTRYVADNPMKAALIAAAIGAAVAGLYLAMRHRRELQDRYF